jgi:hypothetical protein
MKQGNEQAKRALSRDVPDHCRATTAICRGFIGDEIPAIAESPVARIATGSRVAGMEVSTATAVTSSSGGDSEGHVPQRACPSSLSCGDCGETLHELSNVMTSVLTNAQMLGWKLPPYSHLKRPVRQVERSAQRGAELLKCLMRKLGDLE